MVATPSHAGATEDGMRRSPWWISTPIARSNGSFGEPCRTSARTARPWSRSRRQISRPSIPVAPTTRIIFSGVRGSGGPGVGALQLPLQLPLHCHCNFISRGGAENGGRTEQVLRATQAECRPPQSVLLALWMARSAAPLPRNATRRAILRVPRFPLRPPRQAIAVSSPSRAVAVAVLRVSTPRRETLARRISRTGYRYRVRGTSTARYPRVLASAPRAPRIRCRGPPDFRTPGLPDPRTPEQKAPARRR